MEDISHTFDALLPPAMARKAEEIGSRKAKTDLATLFVLGILAGAFIALGAIFSTATTTSLKDTVPFGLIKLISGLTFTLGLILVVVGGAELFTGNMLIIISWLSGKTKFTSLLRNWLIVYVGNFIGAFVTALFIFYSKQYQFNGGALGINILTIAEAKTSLDFLQAIILGILCNALVCMSVWLTYSAKKSSDKIFAIIPPIAAFVASGFEHSIANMYFIPIGLFVKYNSNSSFFESIHKTPADFPHLTWNNFFIMNLLPVTIGNIIGGAILVGFVYWFVYLRNNQST